MIEPQLYRLRIGIHNRYKLHKVNYNFDETYDFKFSLDSISSYLLYFIYTLLITLLYVCFPCMHDVNILSPIVHNTTTSNGHPSSFLRLPVRCKLESMTIIYFGLVSFTYLTLYLHYFVKYRTKFFRKRSHYLTSACLFFISAIRLFLIVICNSSIINPGPWQPTIIYQNVQGLIPFGELNNPNPVLNIEKILELQSYVNINRPDVIILNETWLKNTIPDENILPANQYKIFRKDRSQESHPPDPNDPKKFRRNGGGVLIAVRTDLDVVSQEIKVRAAAEAIFVQVKLKNGAKYIFSTCYRVGTLGIEHHSVFVGTLKKILAKTKPPKLFLIGDFNLPEADWTENKSAVSLEQKFIDSFNELGLKQKITAPTHIKGNILDIFLTNFDSYISNLKVLDHNSVVFSDHFPIEFTVRGNVRRKKMPKREFYNFKKADWVALNSDLNKIDWNRIFDRNNGDVELCWNDFKSILTELINKHIPKVKIKNEFQSPWFDSDCYVACREKEKFRRKFKKSKSDVDGLKFSNARKEFRKLFAQKMCDNLHRARVSRDYLLRPFNK